MSSGQRTLDGGTADDSDGSDKCGSAVMAALGAVSEHCGEDRVPIETSNGLVVMAPKEGIDRARAQASEDMNRTDILDMMDDSPWLGDWTSGVCEAAGHEKGTQDFRDCQLRFAMQVLDQ